MILRDNTKYSSATDNLEEYLSLQNITNKKVSELLDDNGNDLLIYPHSFYQCEDELGKRHMFSLQIHCKEQQCTKVMLETGNIVGFIGVNGIPVSIHSRFSQNTEEDYFLHYMLSRVLCINLVNLPHGTADEQIFNFLLYLFPKLLNEALSQGIYKEYQRNEYNNANVRGVININKHLKTNFPFNGHIAYRTREFSHDNHITELIRHTIEYIGKTKFGKVLLEKDEGTRRNVALIISATSRYSRQEREKVIKSNLKIKNHPYFSRYTPLQKLCLRILRHEKIKYGEKKSKIYGILFDISYLWEEYLATILVNQEFKHPNNRKGTGRIYMTKDKLYPRYPDFYREFDNTIIDAKYKREISRDDIHQMISYMYRLKGLNGIFIQPSENIYQKTDSELLGYGAENNAKLQIFYYHISQATGDYKQFVADMKQSENALKLAISI
ncbi:MAG: hypothetical protein SOR57_09810 [Parabacteroides sp.]|nr:hypothetical protein [Parabacteroides sp.]